MDFNVQPVEPQKTDVQVFLVNKSTDGMLLRPALRYAPKLHRVIGLEDPYFLTFQQVKDSCSRSEEDILKYLKSLDFVSEAQEQRLNTNVRRSGRFALRTFQNSSSPRVFISGFQNTKKCFP